MTRADFVEKFELIAATPDAVRRMRALVLRLAVRGRLVPQIPTEGDADRLVSEYAKRRRCSVEDLYVSTEGQWHEVPSSWRWINLGSVGEIVGGGTPRSDNPAYFSDVNGIPWLTPADLTGFSQKRVFRGRRFITRRGLAESSAQLLPEGSVLFSSRAPIGYVAIAGTELATNQGFKSCVPFIKETNEYLYYYLMSAAARIDSEAPGTTFREVSGRLVSQVPVALPPLAEQRRIVAKVDELIALCDRLEAQQKERETRQAALAAASISCFIAAPTRNNLRFLFHESFETPPSELRKTVLRLAVEGKLVRHKVEDEHGSALLQRMSADAMIEDVSTSGLPFVLPERWAATRLGKALKSGRGISYGIIKLGAEPQNDGVSVLRCSNVRFRKIELAGVRKVTRELSREYSRTILRGGEVLINVRGTLGGCAVVPEALKGYNVAREVAVIPVHQFMDSSFVLNVIASSYFQEQVQENLRGIAYEGLNLAALRDFVIPVPPLAEQRRIVARVNELMALIDSMELQLAVSRLTGVKLLDALMSEMTA